MTATFFFRKVVGNENFQFRVSDWYKRQIGIRRGNTIEGVRRETTTKKKGGNYTARKRLYKRTRLRATWTAPMHLDTLESVM